MDNGQVYRTIRMAMKQLFSTELKGNFARRLSMLAAMLAGIVQARSCKLPRSPAENLIWLKPTVGSNATVAGYRMNLS